MELLSSMTARIPWLPTKAALALTLRSPESVVWEDQAEKLPDSKPSLKIKSDTVPVAVGVGEGPGVLVLTGVFVGNGVPESEVLISQTFPSFSKRLLPLSTPRLAI